MPMNRSVRSSLRLEKTRRKRVSSKTPSMNPKQNANVLISHGSFKHTAKPATLRSVLLAFGLKKDALKESRELVLKEQKQLHVAR